MSPLTGTGELVRVALRRSRILIGTWIGAFVVIAATSASATVDLYPTPVDRLAAAESLNRSQALVAVFGRVYDPTSIGAISMIKLGGIGSVFVAMLAVVLVVRHTRADEESGRSELLGGTATGRVAPVAAAFVVVIATSLALALLTAVGLTLAGLPVDGSLAFGFAWAGVALAFGAIAAVTAQLTTSARAATALASAVLAVVYGLRAVGDAADAGGPRWLSWLSPIGWAQQFRPYAGNHWWVLLVTLGFALVAGGTAFALAARRDLGTGLLPTRPGPANAGPGLRSSLALSWRLQRGALIGWGVGFVFVGALLGGMAGNVGDFLNNPNARDLILRLGGRTGLTNAFLAAELGFAGVLAAAFGIQSVMRLHTEEAELRAQPLLATAVGRLRWAGGHLLIALAGSTLLMVLVGLGAGIARAGDAGDGSEVGRIMGAALVQVPAAWVLVAITIAAFGLAPRAVVVGWAALAVFIVIGELGPLLDLGQWVMDLSPFTHAPKLPGGPFSAVPLLALLAVAVVIGGVGLVGLRRRDIA